MISMAPLRGCNLKVKLQLRTRCFWQGIGRDDEHSPEEGLPRIVSGHLHGQRFQLQPWFSCSTSFLLQKHKSALSQSISCAKLEPSGGDIKVLNGRGNFILRVTICWHFIDATLDKFFLKVTSFVSQHRKWPFIELRRFSLGRRWNCGTGKRRWLVCLARNKLESLKK